MVWVGVDLSQNARRVGGGGICVLVVVDTCHGYVSVLPGIDLTQEREPLPVNVRIDMFISGWLQSVKLSFAKREGTKGLVRLRHRRRRKHRRKLELTLASEGLTWKGQNELRRGGKKDPSPFPESRPLSTCLSHLLFREEAR
ncbi:hypothetical protein LY78DRAFT_660383 [Colletotrichum sublineola]|nr:hypothetical protein LY78DRAFT_660383 [Colletotrichum sublineola]